MFAGCLSTNSCVCQNQNNNNVDRTAPSVRSTTQAKHHEEHRSEWRGLIFMVKLWLLLNFFPHIISSVHAQGESKGHSVCSPATDSSNRNSKSSNHLGAPAVPMVAESEQDIPTNNLHDGYELLLPTPTASPVQNNICENDSWERFMAADPSGYDLEEHSLSASSLNAEDAPPSEEQADTDMNIPTVAPLTPQPPTATLIDGNNVLPCGKRSLLLPQTPTQTQKLCRHKRNIVTPPDLRSVARLPDPPSLPAPVVVTPRLKHCLRGALFDGGHPIEENLQVPMPDHDNNRAWLIPRPVNDPVSKKEEGKKKQPTKVPPEFSGFHIGGRGSGPNNRRANKRLTKVMNGRLAAWIEAGDDRAAQKELISAVIEEAQLRFVRFNMKTGKWEERTYLESQSLVRQKFRTLRSQAKKQEANTLVQKDPPKQAARQVRQQVPVSLHTDDMNVDSEDGRARPLRQQQQQHDDTVDTVDIEDKEARQMLLDNDGMCVDSEDGKQAARQVPQQVPESPHTDDRNVDSEDGTARPLRQNERHHDDADVHNNKKPAAQPLQQQKQHDGFFGWSV